MVGKSAKWWGNMFNLFDVAWAFDGALSLNVFQLLRGPSQEAENNLKNRSKAMLAELSFKSSNTSVWPHGEIINPHLCYFGADITQNMNESHAKACKSLERLMRNFLWEGVDRGKRGLEISNLRLLHEALLAKVLAAFLVSSVDKDPNTLSIPTSSTINDLFTVPSFSHIHSQIEDFPSLNGVGTRKLIEELVTIPSLTPICGQTGDFPALIGVGTPDGERNGGGDEDKPSPSDQLDFCHFLVLVIVLDLLITWRLDWVGLQDVNS
uniref:Uncharacterized protein n=1 Tax=Cucumis melo TaxID=3656 RepID=A0A9I9EL31_CUCME